MLRRLAPGWANSVKITDISVKVLEYSQLDLQRIQDECLTAKPDMTMCSKLIGYTMAGTYTVDHHRVLSCAKGSIFGILQHKTHFSQLATCLSALQSFKQITVTKLHRIVT